MTRSEIQKRLVDAIERPDLSASFLTLQNGSVDSLEMLILLEEAEALAMAEIPEDLIPTLVSVESLVDWVDTVRSHGDS